jgi:hypothetical protein
MRQDLDDKLCEKYPKIFADRHGNMRETCMCFGFCCGDGWYDIIDVLCTHIQNHVDHPPRKWDPEKKEYVVVGEREQVVAEQVKEKFGGLRFYVRGSDERISGMIEMAEAMSFRVCEDCGKPGEVRGGGWIRTLCDGCSEDRKGPRSEVQGEGERVKYEYSCTKCKTGKIVLGEPMAKKLVKSIQCPDCSWGGRKNMVRLGRLADRFAVRLEKLLGLKALVSIGKSNGVDDVMLYVDLREQPPMKTSRVKFGAFQGVPVVVLH